MSLLAEKTAIAKAFPLAKPRPISANIDIVGECADVQISRAYAFACNHSKDGITFEKNAPEEFNFDGDYIERKCLPICSRSKDNTMVFSPQDKSWFLTVAMTKANLGTDASLTVGKPSVEVTENTITKLSNCSTKTDSQGTKFLIPATQACKAFAIEFKFTLTNLTLCQSDGRIWFEHRGKQVLSIGNPVILDTEFNQIGPELQLVDYTLKLDHDTWTYTKVPGPDFAEAKLPKDYFIDAEVIYGTSPCGSVELTYDNPAAFPVARLALLGDTLDVSGELYAGIVGKRIIRFFGFFDLSAISKTEWVCLAATFNYTGYYASSAYPYTPPTFVLQKHTTTQPLSFASYGHLAPGIGSDAISAIANGTTGANLMAITDLDYVTAAFGSVLKVARIGDKYDYKGVTPVADSYLGQHVVNTYDEITVGPAPTPTTTAISRIPHTLGLLKNETRFIPGQTTQSKFGERS